MMAALTDDFNRADSAAGGVANSWADSGSRFSISGNAVSASAGTIYSNGPTHALLRPEGEALADPIIVLRTPAIDLTSTEGGHYRVIILKYNPVSKVGLYAVKRNGNWCQIYEQANGKPLLLQSASFPSGWSNTVQEYVWVASFTPNGDGSGTVSWRAWAADIYDGDTAVIGGGRIPDATPLWNVSFSCTNPALQGKCLQGLSSVFAISIADEVIIESLGVRDLDAGTIGAASTTDGETVSIASATAASSYEGGITYQWHASETPNFVPDFGSLLTGKTSETLSYAPGHKRLLWYTRRATDADEKFIDSRRLPYILEERPVRLFAIGDSITGGTVSGFQPVPIAATTLGNLLNASVTYVDRGLGGRGTADFLVGTTDGDATYALIESGDYVQIQLGTNDVNTAVTKATYKANITAIANKCLELGAAKVILLPAPHYITPQISTYANHEVLMPQYREALIEIANGTTILAPSQLAFELTVNNPSYMGNDGVHLTAEGYTALSQAWALIWAGTLGSSVASSKTLLSRAVSGTIRRTTRSTLR